MILDKYKIALPFVMTAFMVSAAYCQEKSENRQIKTITGTVLNTDAVGNIISIRTEDQKQMAFNVPDKVVITQETHNIGLMDIRNSDSVTMQYYESPSLKYFVVSIVDNKSVVNE